MNRRSQTSRKRLHILQLAAVIFFTVSGGPYGLEPLFSYAGANAALLLLVICPILWDVPAILTVLELNSMMPVNGGYYQWVKRALGPRWGFYEGFWTWIYTFVDLAVYPVLFVEYASFFFPQLHLYKIPVCLFIIWASAILNILGIVPVGKISIVLGLFVLSPFVILWAVTLFTHHGTTGLSHLSLKGVGFSSIGLGIYTVMWNFFGWDNATTYAGEVDRPVRSYVISSALAFVTVFAMYILTSMAVLHSGIDFKVLSDKGFPSIATATSVRGLGTLLAIGGMASAVGLFSAVLLSVSRVPKVMADDGLMPEKLNTLHSKYQTPYISIIVSALIISLMIFWSFTDLIIMDVTLYGAGLFLEFISLIVLRIKAPDEHRPFKIPMKIGALCVMYILSVSIYVIGLTGALSHSDATFIPAFIAVLALISAEIAWRIIVKVKLKAAAAKVKSKGNI
ncbi:MAG TPA: APC family permease [Puia sp.]|jgi:amino acid transporter|nr:APC family permease [Puia sp.]